MAGESLGAIRGKIEIDYDDKGVGRAKSSLGSLEDEGQKTTTGIAAFFGTMAGSIVAELGKLALEGALKIASMVKDSIASFGSFQQGMNEVFTLLPGISGKAMDQMTQQTLATAKEMKVMPEEVVPALYSALSAGVPPDNVFDFLITANKLAKGGVTTLDTAVSTMASTVNAYGSDVINAEQVSDLLFTAVKGGITTIDELGGSMSNVVPTAAGLGIEFGNVTAALATMTSQGTPTAQATTQLRQLFVELSKEGGQAAKTFEDIAGKSFRDFIAGGGDVQEALQLMEKAAKQEDVAITDLFGSVEAGNAALNLTGAGTKKFTAELEAAKNSAGATDEAFNTMSSGISDAWAEAKVALDVFVKGALLKLAPLIESALKRATAAFTSLTKNAGPALRRLADLIQRFKTPLQVIGTIIAVVFIPHWIALGVAATVSAAKAVAAWVAMQVRAVVSAAIHSALIARMIAGWVLMAARATASAARVAVAWAISNAGAAAGAAIAIGALVAMIARWAWAGAQALLHAAKIALAWLISLGPIGLIIAAIALVVAAFLWLWNNVEGFRNFWIAVWNVLKTAFTAVFDFLVAYITFWVNTFKTVFTTSLNFIKAVWQAVWNFVKAYFTTIFNGLVAYVKFVLNAYKTVFQTVLKAIQAVWKAAWNAVKTAITTVFTFISNVVKNRIAFWKSVITTGLNAIKKIFTTVWNAAKAVVTTVMNAIRNVVQSGINRVKSAINGVKEVVATVRNAFNNARQAAVDKLGQLVSFVRGIPGKIKSALGNLSSRLFSAGQDIIRGLINGIKNMAGQAAQAAKDAVKNALDGAKNLLGIGSPSKVFRDEIGGPIMQGVAVGVDRSRMLPQEAVASALGTLPRIASPGISVAGGDGSASKVMNFGPGAIVLDMSKMRSINDVVKAVENLKVTSRQFVSRP